MQIVSYLHAIVENTIQFSLETFFFCGYRQLPQKLIQERMATLMNKGAKKLEDLQVEAYHLPASAEKTHIVIFAHTSSFWQFRPHNYDHLKGHADVVLWNPSRFNPVQYQNDLQSVVEKVRKLHPDKKISIIGRCATVDPTIAVAAELKDKNINLVLDRGHGNAIKLARSYTFLSLLPIVQNILSKFFDCKGEEKISEVPGKILFLRSRCDQVMQWNEQDLVCELINKRGKHVGDQTLIPQQDGDHWTPWSQATHQKVYQFIGLENVDVSAFPEKLAPTTFFAQNILPILTQAWC